MTKHLVLCFSWGIYSLKGVSATGPRWWPLKTDAPCHSRGGTLKNLHCSMAMSAEHRSKFAALHRQWLRLHMSEKFPSGSKKHKTSKLWETIVFTCVHISNVFLISISYGFVRALLVFKIPKEIMAKQWNSSPVWLSVNISLSPGQFQSNMAQRP